MDSHFAKPHALLVCGPGLGHVNGCLALAKSLASAGFSVTLACFARCYHTHSKTKRLNPLDPAIRFEIVPDGLEPPVAQNYVDLFVMTEAMREGVERLVEKLRVEEQHNPVTCIISDSFMAWTQDVANKLGMPRIEFFTSNATTYLLALAIPQLIAEGYVAAQIKGTSDHADEAQLKLSENPAGVFIDCIKGLPRFPLHELDRGIRFAHPNNPILQAAREGAARATEAERVLIHSVAALESSAFESLFKEYGIKGYAVGPLIMDDPTTQAHQQQLGCPDPAPECLTWLDGRASSSVLYVSFGSNATLSRQEIVELALGLEASGQPFLWVVRSDATPEAGLQLSDILPLGFETRTQSRGLIVPWVPQLAVLAHPAVGGFLTHCGWNSTLESLWMGVPMLCCPRRAEQKTNARFIAQDWAVGIELQRTATEGFHRCEVEKSVKALMTAEEGLHARTRAQELKGLVRKAKTASHSNLVALVNDMKTLLPP